MEEKSKLFDLSETIKYANKKEGREDETAQVEMYAPTRATSKFFHKMSSLLMKAMLQAQGSMSQLQASAEDIKKVSKDDDGKALDSGESVYGLFLIAGIDFSEVEDLFASVVHKVCFLDENKKVPMTSYLFDQLSIKDAKDLVCEYIATFISPSVISLD